MDLSLSFCTMCFPFVIHLAFSFRSVLCVLLLSFPCAHGFSPSCFLSLYMDIPTSGGSRKSVRGWRLVWRGGGYGPKPIFAAFSRQYNPLFLIYTKKKTKENLERGGGRRFAVLLDPPVISTPRWLFIYLYIADAFLRLNEMWYSYQPNNCMQIITENSLVSPIFSTD
jgi:hypothetical protein